MSDPVRMDADILDRLRAFRNGRAVAVYKGSEDLHVLSLQQPTPVAWLDEVIDLVERLRSELAR